jgi:anti-anti-sigma regulatory factor
MLNRGGEKGDFFPVSSRIALRGDYDIWRRDELRADLGSLDLSDDITIDMSRVTLMDAGAASLLIALQHRLRERNPKANVILQGTPRIVKRVLELCGAGALFVFAAKR